MTRRRPRWTSTMAAALVAIVLAGCGSAGPGRFDDEVAAIRSAIDGGDAPGARSGVQALAEDAFAARDDGTIDDTELQEVARLVEYLRTQLDVELPLEPPVATPAVQTPAPTPAPADPGKSDDGKSKGKGGKNKDD